MEITADIFCQVDDKTHKRLIDEILDAAKQKGTGKWTVQDALELETPSPTIDMAVSMRNLSALKEEREAASKVLKGPSPVLHEDHTTFTNRLRNAFYAAMILTYTQGMNQLRSASQAYNYELDLEVVARIWRGGCIIRAGLLEDIRAAYRAQPDLANLLMNDHFGQIVNTHQTDLRYVVQTAAELGLPAPAFMASLGYFDSYRSAWLPASLIQAQRDYFGAHTYERVDEKGVFHTQWDQDD